MKKDWMFPVECWSPYQDGAVHKPTEVRKLQYFPEPARELYPQNPYANGALSYLNPRRW